MDNPTFIDEEDIPVVHQEEDDDYRTPDTSRMDETLFTFIPDTTDATPTLFFRQKLKRDKIISLYRYLSATGNPGLADLDQFKIRRNSKTGNIELLFLDVYKHWQSLTNKRTGKFLVPKTLGERFGGLNTMKSVLSLDETPPVLERSFKAVQRLCRELSTDLEMGSIPLE